MDKQIRNFSPLEFENIVIECLDGLMTNSQKENSVREESGKFRNRIVYYDFIANNGIDGLKMTGPVIVEIKQRILLSTYQRLQDLSRFLKITHKAQFLVVYHESEVVIPKRGDVIFISFEEIIQRYKDYTGKDPEDKNEHRELTEDDILNLAVNALTSGPATLFLGSGVSVDAGAPLWDDLLKHLLAENKNLAPLGLNADDYDWIKIQFGHSSLIVARYLMDNSISEEVLISNIRRTIYQRDKRDYKSQVNVLSSLSSLVTKCKNIRCAITFNYDSLFEEALKAYHLNPIPFYKKGSYKNDDFPIFHVHGFVGRTEEEGASKEITLSEYDYHRRYASADHWANIEIQHALNRTSCFFIGLSMTDPNLRRLIDFAKHDDQKNVPHFLFLKSIDFEDKKGVKNSKASRKHRQQVEKMYRNMGLNVIWVESNPDNPNDYSRLPVLINKIRDLVDFKMKDNENNKN